MKRCLMVLGILALWLASVPVTSWASDTPDEEVIQIRTPETKIIIVAVSPRMTNEGLIDTSVAKQSSTGLPVVGVGEQVYVAASPGGLDVTAFDWVLTAASGSSAALEDATGVGKAFTADVEGDYVVTLTMTHAGGDTTLMQTITASTYVGTARCAQCHSSTHDTWEETNHAKALSKKISGFQTGNFRSFCIKCHSVGANTSGIATGTPDNGGFWDVAADEGWTFPDDLTQGTWAPVADGATASENAFSNGAWTVDLTGSVYEQFPDALKDVSNIGCESCHGPGEAHASGGFAGETDKKIGVSLENGVCAKCHDDGHYHVRPHEWEESGHGQTWTRSSTSCSPCHLGSGRIAGIEQGVDFLAGETAASGTFQLGVTITCATCHEPHGETGHKKQVRWAGTVEMEAMVDGMGSDPVQFTSIDLGLGATCAQCHHMRAGRNELDTSLHRSHQTEMLLGVGGYHYTDEDYPSGGHQHVENSCAACHMADPPAGVDAKLGSHSWNMHDEEAGVYNTNACESCHGPLSDFNVNGAKTEIDDLLAVLVDLVPNDEGEPYTHDNGGHGSSPEPLTDAQLKAGWNAAFVLEDGSGGIHNFRYSRKLLVDAITAMQGGTPSATAGDFNGSGQVDFSDIFMFTAEFGKSSASSDWNPAFDLSGNGSIGFTDWLMLIDIFGQTTASSKPVSFVDNGVNTGARFALYGSDMRSVDQEHIAVRLTVDGLAEMRGYAVGLSYDTDRLAFVRAVRATDGLIRSGAVLNVMNGTPGHVTVSDAVVGNEAVRGGGDLVDVIFKMKAPASASSVSIDFTQIADLNYGINRPSFAETIGSGEAFAYALEQNYPNPFNPATSIRYAVAEPGWVTIDVYNALGQKVRTLVENHRVAGEYTANWDARDFNGRDVASGVYIYRMNVNGFESAHRMVLVR